MSKPLKDMTNQELYEICHRAKQGESMNRKYYSDIEQGSEAWHEARRGILTASQVSLLVTAKTLKVANNDKVRTHAYEMAAQRETGHVEESYQGYQMVRGHIEEILARDLYSENISQVTECGFVTAEIGGVTIGYSPDGLVGDDGLIEIKARIQKHQMKTITDDLVPADYMMQIQTGLLVTGREWLDFISYSNGMPLYVSRVFPDDEIQAKIIEAAVMFEDSVSTIQKKYQEAAAYMILAPRVDYGFDDDISSSTEGE